MLLEEDRIRHHRTHPAGTQEPGDRYDVMNKKNDPIAQFFIVAKPGIAWGCVTNQQFARDRSKQSDFNPFSQS
jgi:hypothetical protein